MTIKGADIDYDKIKREQEEIDRRMALPEGKTCKDCRHWVRCKVLGFSDSGENKRCDFHPSRYVD